MKTGIGLAVVFALASLCFGVRAANENSAQDIGEEVYEELLRSRSFKFGDRNTTLYVKDARNRILYQPVILQCDAAGRVVSLMWAKEARLSVDAKGGNILLAMQDGNIVHDDWRVRFEDKIISIALPKPEPIPKPTAEPAVDKK